MFFYNYSHFNNVEVLLVTIDTENIRNLLSIVKRNETELIIKKILPHNTRLQNMVSV